MSATSTTQTGRKGDIRIAFGFERVKDYALPEPVIYLYTLRNKHVMVNVPSCFMHEFDERERDPITKEPKCIAKCQAIAETLYGMPTSYGAHRVLDAITDWMTEVKNMPPPNTYRNPDGYLDEMKRRGFDVIG